MPTRTTKDGTFLDALVTEGLLAVVGKPVPPADVPTQFRMRYKLTPLGRHAAEYGEYERAYTPEVKPPTGLAAELLAAREGRSFAPHPRRGKKS